MYPQNLQIPKVGVSLKHLTYACLNHSLDKSKSITMSNWDQRPLSKAQLEYAGKPFKCKNFLFQYQFLFFLSYGCIYSYYDI
jgi:hypothetical protein